MWNLNCYFYLIVGGYWLELPPPSLSFHAVSWLVLYITGSNYVALYSYLIYTGRVLLAWGGSLRISWLSGLWVSSMYDRISWIPFLLVHCMVYIPVSCCVMAIILALMYGESSYECTFL